MTFGEKIRKRRKELNLTQTQLADKIGVSTRTIVSYEQDGKYPRKRNAFFKIADILDVDVNYLLMETGDTAFIPVPSAKRSTVSNLAPMPVHKLIYDFQALVCSEALNTTEKDSLMQCLSTIYQQNQSCKNF